MPFLNYDGVVTTNHDIAVITYNNDSSLVVVELQLRGVPHAHQLVFVGEEQ